MIELLGPDEFLRKQKDGLVCLDTRSPGEYAAGHIVGARSLPLFTDEERARVGTTYKQVDPREALLEGFEIVGPKMRWLVEEAARLSGADFGLAPKPETRPKIGVYCWRGGSRSGSVSWLLETAGFDVYRLRGGYKAYRGHARAFIDGLDVDFRVIDGLTGSGKTVLLHELAKVGAQVLDLEGIANHKGSAFGLTPGEEQPTTEHAENVVYDVLSAMDPVDPIWVENESRNVGRVYLPDGLVSAIERGRRYELRVPKAERVGHIVSQYGKYKRQVLADTFHHLRKRLGGAATQEAIAAVDAGDLARAAEIALVYYDKAYRHYSERQGWTDTTVLEASISSFPTLARELARGSERSALMPPARHDA